MGGFFYPQTPPKGHTHLHLAEYKNLRQEQSSPHELFVLCHTIVEDTLSIILPFEAILQVKNSLLMHLPVIIQKPRVHLCLFSPSLQPHLTEKIS